MLPAILKQKLEQKLEQKLKKKLPTLSSGRRYASSNPISDVGVGNQNRTVFEEMTS